VEDRLTTLSNGLSSIDSNAHTWSGDNTFTQNIVVSSINSLNIYNDLTNQNTLIGHIPETYTINGSYNTSLGLYALRTVSGNNNVAVGQSALLVCNESNCVGIGAGTLTNCNGGSNTAIGANAGGNCHLSSSCYNTFLGYNTSCDTINNSYSSSTAVGSNAQIFDSHQIVLGTVNDTTTCMGGGLVVPANDALVNSLTIGRGSSNIPTNTAVGYQALIADTTGTQNTAIGYQSLVADTTGSGNTSIGYRSLEGDQVGHFNTSIGANSLQSSTASAGCNTAVGCSSMGALTTGAYNTSIGMNAHRDILTGSASVGVGCGAGLTHVSGDYSNFLGYQSGKNVVTGAGNNFLGTYTGQDISTNTYNFSTAIGHAATITGSHQIILGTVNETTYSMGGLTIPSTETLSSLGTTTLQATTTTTLTSSDVITANGGLTIPSTETLNLNGDIVAAGVNVSPTELSYLNGATPNLQNQLNLLQVQSINAPSTTAPKHGMPL
jgi:hypothetical protein